MISLTLWSWSVEYVSILSRVKGVMQGDDDRGMDMRKVG